MRIELTVLLVYLLVVNLYTFAIYGIDKNRAKTGKWRISEKHLLLAAFLGGSLGAFMAMKTFRHKTKHGLFKWGVPAMGFIHIIGLAYAVSQGWIKF